MEKYNKHKIKAELELNIISAMILVPKIISENISSITAEDISEENRPAFKVIAELEQSGNTDNQTIIQRLKSSLVETEKYILRKCFWTSANLAYEIEQLIKVNTLIALEERLKYYLDQLSQDAEPGALIDELRHDLQTLDNRGEANKNERFDSDYVTEIVQNLRDKVARPNEFTVTSQNIPTLNHMTGGFVPGNLVSIAGYFKNGKTSIALNLLLDFAINKKIPSGYFSLEMPKTELDAKIISNIASVDYQSIRDPKLLMPGEIDEIEKRLLKHADGQLWLTDDSRTLEKIWQKAKQWKAVNGVKAVFVDYIGLVRVLGMNMKKRDEVQEYVSQEFKSMAKELDMVVVLLAQLNREGGKDPSATNIAGTISIPRDSDFFFTIHKPVKVGQKSFNCMMLDESHFILKLDESRHTPAGGQILLQLQNGSRMVEITSDYETAQ